MTVAFIRHGQTDWNRDDKLQGSTDIPLNDTGRAQAHDAVRLLAGQGWQVVVSSPMLRARETAEIIATDLAIELGPAYPDFVERDYGDLEGGPSSETMARWPNRDYPGAEPLDSVVARGLAGLARVEADFVDRNVVIVCHGTIIRYTLASLAGFPLDGIRNGSISTIERVEDGWRVLTVNGEPLHRASASTAPDPSGIAG
ncbi:MAG: histidine phosphatase family protein [Acidobacteria bacterium]|nr:histidine phosphatase family protein [Acidobacteriota bacterium]